MKIKDISEHPDLERVANAKEELRVARIQLKNSVQDAIKAGYSLREIADVAGVSNVTVLNWSKNGKPVKAT